MQGSYPISRCPACKKAFRAEVKDATISLPYDLSLLLCPHCGLVFNRFDPEYLKSSGRETAAR